MESHVSKKSSYGLLVFCAILAIAIAFGGYKYYVLGQEYKANKADLEGKIATLNGNVAGLELERTSLNDALASERERNDEFQDQIDDLSGTIGTLTKLSKTDKELLKKYSKVYFLNENYIPPRLVNIDKEYLFDKNKPAEFHAQAWYFLKKLLEKAATDRGSLNLQVSSGYRSFGTQESLKANYKVIFGAGTANQFSAEQGYSEHQLGTAIDFTTPATGAPLTGFDTTAEYKWLQNNAYKYGFELSYPSGNTYYQYEPWHWRFVGMDLAQKLHDDHKNFYDLDQREIDTYLISIFDK